MDEPVNSRPNSDAAPTPPIEDASTGAVTAAAEEAQGRYRCRGCGYRAKDNWSYRCGPRSARACPGCGGYYDVLGKGSEKKQVSMSTLRRSTPPKRIKTNIHEFDYLLGGDDPGLFPGATALLGGLRGVGKTTLLLEAANGVAQEGRTALYAAGEQHEWGLAAFMRRLFDRDNDNLHVMGLESDLYKITTTATSINPKPSLVVVDSIQTIEAHDVGGGAGTAEQVNTAAQWLTSFAMDEKIPVIAVCQLKKDGDFAGTGSLQHLVDVIIAFDHYVYREDDEDSDEEALLGLDLQAKRLRELRVLGKNRYGPVGRILLQMSEKGRMQSPPKRQRSRLLHGPWPTKGAPKDRDQ